MSDDLVARLRHAWDERERQLDEDERVAREASAGGSWSYPGSDSVAGWALYDEHWTIANLVTYEHETYDYAERMPGARHPRYVNADANGAHIARHDPARVLAEVERGRRDIAAKRRIVDRYEDAIARQQDPDESQIAAHIHAEEYEGWIIPELAEAEGLA